MKNKYIVYAETPRGGHVAWLSGFFPTRGLSWLDKANLDSIEGFIEHLHPESSPRVRRRTGSPQTPKKSKEKKNFKINLASSTIASETAV